MPKLRGLSIILSAVIMSAVIMSAPAAAVRAQDGAAAQTKEQK